MEPGQILPARAARSVALTRARVARCFAIAPNPIRRRSPRSADGPVIIRGDHDLNPGMEVEPRPVAAAVLVPLIERPRGLNVLFTLRTEHLTAHAGQVSFPGGRIDARDADAASAALREAEEEIGLPPPLVEVVGRLDTYVTRTGFEVVPVVGFVDPGFEPRLDPVEVAEVFEVPLDFLVDPANHRRQSREYQGTLRWFYAMPWERHFIWGATAGMLVNLAEVLREER